ncbi:MAG: histidine kinase [Bacteroidota bacterium]
MQHPTILYVDDEPDNLTAFKAVFRRQYNILLANGALEAMQKLTEQTVHLIISDQRMPGMTGVEFFEKIKDEYPEAIRMVLTGYTDMQAIIDAINKGKIYHYIAKPWKAEELNIIIKRALESYNLRQRNRELERRNVQAQFETLKNQINPHFLFNSMNILASLIPIDPEKAIKFTKGFSKLYRSVLQLKEQPLISLQEEMEFVSDYFLLQKMRFGDNLILNDNIPAEKLKDDLPPFALQILLENAVKHNIIAEDSPLEISIFTEGDFIILKNNFQPRGSVENSTGTGLENLRSRYGLLGAGEVEVKETDGFFVAKIPLIKAL